MVTGIRDLTYEERRSIAYFHQEKGDVTRWAEWQDVQLILQEHHPELLKALRDVEIAEKTLDAIIRTL
jgi:hypothetical protein